MSAYALLREKPIRVESFGIRKVFWSPVQKRGQYSYVSASRNDIITCWNKEDTPHSTPITRELSHWTLDTIKLPQVADEHLFQIWPRTVNTTGWLTRRLCQPSVCSQHVGSEGGKLRFFVQSFHVFRKHKRGNKY